MGFFPLIGWKNYVELFFLPFLKWSGFLWTTYLQKIVAILKESKHKNLN
jgi:hypothetical protein